MKVYTLQPQAVLDTLLAGQTYRPDPALCRSDGFLNDDQQVLRAYHWVAGKLAQQKAPPQPDALPVWVWHTHDPGHPEGDLRRHRPYAPGVLLELEVDPARVLLSDFDLWHAPLNGTFLGTEEEDRAFDQECELRGIDGWNAFWHNEELAQAALASWDHCLDLDWYAPNWYGEARERKRIQGVMWEIRPEDVLRHRRYKGWKWRGGESASFGGGKPVFNLQAIHPVKFLAVVGHQRQVQ